MSVINWFKHINYKRLYKFFRFDINNFYPSIKETSLHEAVQFAEGHKRT